MLQCLVPLVINLATSKLYIQYILMHACFPCTVIPHKVSYLRVGRIKEVFMFLQINPITEIFMSP